MLTVIAFLIPTQAVAAVRLRVEPGPYNHRHAVQTGLDSLKALGGGTLRLAPGEFIFENVQNAVVCDSCRDITIVGSGVSTIIRSAPGEDGADAFMLFRHCRRIHFRNLRMEGLMLPRKAWEDNMSYHGALRFMDSRDIRIDSCTFSGFFTGAVIFQGSRAVKVSHCEFDSVAYRMKGDYGAVAFESGSGRGEVFRNTFKGLVHSAISAYAADSMDIRLNRAEFDSSSTLSMGFYAPAGLLHSSVARNRFIGAFNEGVVIASGAIGVRGNQIERNVLTARFAGVALNESRFGCSQEPARDNTVNGNDISGVGADSVRHAVLLNRSARTRVSGNRLRRFHHSVSIQYCSSETEMTGNTAR